MQPQSMPVYAVQLVPVLVPVATVSVALPVATVRGMGMQHFQQPMQSPSESQQPLWPAATAQQLQQHPALAQQLQYSRQAHVMFPAQSTPQQAYHFEQAMQSRFRSGAFLDNTYVQQGQFQVASGQVQQMSTLPVGPGPQHLQPQGPRGLPMVFILANIIHAYCNTYL